MIPRPFGQAWAAARRLLDPERPGKDSPAVPGDRSPGDGRAPLPVAVDRQTLDLVVFGTVAAGKTALVRALVGRAGGEAGATLDVGTHRSAEIRDPGPP